MSLGPSTVRTPAIVALLFTAMVLTSVLTLEAVRTEHAHRAAVEEALRNDASVVGDDLMRRTVFEFEALASQPLRSAVESYLVEHGQPPPLEVLRKDERLSEAIEILDRIFVINMQTRRVEPAVPEPFQAWLLTELPRVMAERSARGIQPTVRLRLAGGEHLFIYGAVDSSQLFVCTIREAGIGVLARRAFGRRSVFPGVLGGGRLTNRDVFIRMSRGNLELLRTPGDFNPGAGITMRINGYGDAVRGIVVQSSIAPSAIPALIAGGLPPSHVPLLLIMLFTSVAVLVAAFTILRRERQLADIRSDFVAGVSHELRTPLTQIRMFAETLLFDRVRSSDERQRSLQIINEEARRLTNLVDNVLFLSRPSPGGGARAAGECDVVALVTDAVDAFAPLAMRRDVVVKIDLPPRLRARVDGEAWKQVLTNMLDNAVKYGPAGQTVSVRVTAADEWFRMEVDDEGPGVPLAERESVWRKFHRLERDRGTHKAGSGIGLAIVREIVERHSGRCRVEEAPGGGARFVVEVPLDIGGAPLPEMARTEVAG
jgi:signal transduction histidine kinase